MAWIMRPSIALEDCPEMNWTAQTIADILKRNSSVVARFSSLPPDHPDYIKAGDAPAGLPVPPPAEPLQMIVSKVHGSLPDALPLGVVNQRIKDAVESIQPGVHQFFPVRMTMPDGSIDQGHFLMRPCHRVDAVAIDRSVDVYEYRPRPEECPDWIYYRSNWDNRTKISIYRDRVFGMAIWFDWRIQNTFFHEELGKHFLSSGIRGFRLRPEDDLMRDNHAKEV